MPLGEPDLDRLEQDVLRRYQDLTTVLGFQRARQMFLGEYVGLKTDPRIPTEQRRRFVKTASVLFPGTETQLLRLEAEFRDHSEEASPEA